MRINHNVAALNTYSRLTQATGAQAKSLEKLSSGLRINKAGDDAAGLAISEKMRSQIKGLDQSSRNAQDGISMIQTAEGALSETHAMLQRMRELTVQANNDTNILEDRQAIQKEIKELNTEIDRIKDKTTFNTKVLLDGSLGVKAGGAGTAEATLATASVGISVNGISTGATITLSVNANVLGVKVGNVYQSIDVTTVNGNGNINAIKQGTLLDFDKVGLKLDFTSGAATTDLSTYNAKTIITAGNAASFQIGPDKATTLDISISDMGTTALGVSNVNVVTNAFNTDVTSIDNAIKSVSTQRAQLGAWQNRLEHTITNLTVSSENLTAAESRVRDVDMAKEMMEFTKNNILNQAATAMLAQANQQPQGVLQLLR